MQDIKKNDKSNSSCNAGSPKPRTRGVLPYMTWKEKSLRSERLGRPSDPAVRCRVAHIGAVATVI